MTNEPTKKIISFSNQSEDDLMKKTLHLSILRKRKMILLLTEKVEILNMELDIIKREYHVRIGRLYLKDDQLDLEIIRYKHIKSLLENGYTYDQAIRKINEQYYAEKKVFDVRNDQILHDEEVLMKRKVSENVSQDAIKSLWKKLLFQLHPDLTTNNEEKKKREIIMRKINLAYTENDFEKLKNIENQHYIEPPEETTIENLEKTIIDLVIRIEYLQDKNKELLASEWNMWRKKSLKAKKDNKDIFKQLEEQLLEDIVRKISIVNTYRQEFDNNGFY